MMNSYGGDSPFAVQNLKVTVIENEFVFYGYRTFDRSHERIYSREVSRFATKTFSDGNGRKS